MECIEIIVIIIASLIVLIPILLYVFRRNKGCNCKCEDCLKNCNRKK